MDKHNPTWVSQIIEALTLFDQPLSGRQLVDLTGASVNQVSASLYFLQKKLVIEAVNIQDEPFWFLTGKDAREREIPERKLEDTRNRKSGYHTSKRPAGTLIKPRSQKRKKPDDPPVSPS